MLIVRFLKIYKIEIPELAPGDKIPLVISTAYIDSVTPYPAVVAQDAEQLVLYTTYKYVPTVYKTLKQKTKIKYWQ
jgi:oligosaccharyltransferase complex subunit alpha (ribophorin I)